MIYITGDIHGSPERLGVHSFYEQKEMTRDDIVIICGDFGMVWEESGYRYRWFLLGDWS